MKSPELAIFCIAVDKYFKTLRKLLDFPRNRSPFVFISALKPPVLATFIVFA
jgi:hypothetical protein